MGYMQYLSSNKVNVEYYLWNGKMRLDCRCQINGKIYGLGILHTAGESIQQLFYLMHISFKKTIKKIEKGKNETK